MRGGESEWWKEGIPELIKKEAILLCGGFLKKRSEGISKGCCEGTVMCSLGA